MLNVVLLCFGKIFFKSGSVLPEFVVVCCQFSLHGSFWSIRCCWFWKEAWVFSSMESLGLLCFGKKILLSIFLPHVLESNAWITLMHALAGLLNCPSPSLSLGSCCGNKSVEIKSNLLPFMEIMSLRCFSSLKERITSSLLPVFDLERMACPLRLNVHVFNERKI